MMTLRTLGTSHFGAVVLVGGRHARSDGICDFGATFEDGDKAEKHRIDLCEEPRFTVTAD